LGYCGIPVLQHPPSPIAAATVHRNHNPAHSDCAAILSSIAMQPPSPIAIVLPPLLSLITATVIHGNSHHNCNAVPLSIALPPLSPIAILLPPLSSFILTPSATHRSNCHLLQSSHQLAIHCAIAAIVHCNFSAIVPHCITS
jgi:hypothetical protein